MSAPLVVNTVEGTVWTLRPETRDGQALYAPEKCGQCPVFVMATYAELAVHGIAGSADVLPVPVGPEPRELFLALYDGVEPELFTTVEAARECCDDVAKVDAGEKCWDWTVTEYGVHVQFWTHPDDDRPLSETSGSVTPIVVQGAEPLSELEALRARVAELETAPATVFRASHESIVMGLYTTAAAARAHCEAEERYSWAKFEDLSFDWIEDEEDGVAELTATVDGEECSTGYIVTALEIASAFDEEADA